MAGYSPAKSPDIVLELLLIFYAKPLDEDYSHIGFYYNEFCRLQNINPEEYRGSLLKSNKVDQRRLFITCMIRIYLPHMHVATAGSIRLDYGFVQRLSQTIDQKKPNISKMVQEVIIMEKVYDEFQERITQIVEQLINLVKQVR